MTKKPKIIHLILEAMQDETEKEYRESRVPGKYRASEVGDCPRAIQYSVMGRERQAVGPELKLLFEDGHVHHEAVRRLLSKVGRVTNAEHHVDRRYTIRFRETDVTFQLTATTDGIFEGRYIFDVKGINPFSFSKLSHEYIKENYPHYIDQLQVYMNIFEKELGFLLFKNKMTAELQIYWYKRDPNHFKRILFKLAQITDATERKTMIKRPFTKSSKPCKQCDMRIHCWGSNTRERRWKQA